MKSSLSKWVFASAFLLDFSSASLGQAPESNPNLNSGQVYC